MKCINVNRKLNTIDVFVKERYIQKDIIQK